MLFFEVDLKINKKTKKQSFTLGGKDYKIWTKTELGFVTINRRQELNKPGNVFYTTIEIVSNKVRGRIDVSAFHYFLPKRESVYEVQWRKGVKNISL